MTTPVKPGLIDYGAGNLQSVFNTLKVLGHPPVMVRRPEDMERITHLILPGVGAYGDCSTKLEQQGLTESIRSWIKQDLPMLGICVGYQILFEDGEETPGIPGLGIFPGQVVRFPSGTLKIPHMGWNSISIRDTSHPIWQGIPDQSYFYFVHSYFPHPADESIISATCTYGVSFAAAITHERTIATQFHPEKSQTLGLRLIQNFLTL